MTSAPTPNAGAAGQDFPATPASPRSVSRRRNGDAIDTLVATARWRRARFAASRERMRRGPARGPGKHDARGLEAARERRRRSRGRGGHPGGGLRLRSIARRSRARHGAPACRDARVLRRRSGNARRRDPGWHRIHRRAPCARRGSGGPRLRAEQQVRPREVRGEAVGPSGSRSRSTGGSFASTPSSTTRSRPRRRSSIS